MKTKSGMDIVAGTRIHDATHVKPRFAADATYNYGGGASQWAIQEQSKDPAFPEEAVGLGGTTPPKNPHAEIPSPVIPVPTQTPLERGVYRGSDRRR